MFTLWPFRMSDGGETASVRAADESYSGGPGEGRDVGQIDGEEAGPFVTPFFRQTNSGSPLSEGQRRSLP